MELWGLYDEFQRQLSTSFRAHIPQLPSIISLRPYCLIQDGNFVGPVLELYSP